MMNFRCMLLSLVAVVALVGCATTQESPEDLQIEQVDRGVQGAYVFDGMELTFSSVEVGTQELEVVLELNGVTLMAIVDPVAGVSELDGFATETGANTQLLQADRILLVQFLRNLDALGGDLDRPTTFLRRVTSLFSQHPASVDLQRQIVAEADRGYTSICWALNSYQSATHDGNKGSRWSDATTLNNAYISFHGSCGAADGTYFYNSGWRCYESDHQTWVEYAYGNCFGRCGPGCGGDRQFTWDCVDHDSCVRNGHATYSGWCADELTSASDDELFAPDC